MNKINVMGQAYDVQDLPKVMRAVVVSLNQKGLTLEQAEAKIAGQANRHKYSDKGMDNLREAVFKA